MKITMESKFEVGDRIKCFHEYHYVIKVRYLSDECTFSYLLEDSDDERTWQLEEDIESVDE